MAFVGKINEIWAQYDSAHLTIYTPGQAVKSIEIPEGASWELHVETDSLWPEVSPYATAITMGGGDINFGEAAQWSGKAKRFSFNMGRMPARQVNVGRIRFWRNAANTNVPPPSGDR